MARQTDQSSINRRRFLKQSAGMGGAALACGVWSSSLGAASRSANEKLNIGSIGVGGKGWDDMTSVSGENIVAICDVDQLRLGKAAEKFPRATSYVDFRQLLEQKDIDAVTISTPDHTHAPAAAMAMKLGKHVYCQKPLTHSIYEARALQRIARESGVATQMGNQGHADPGSRQMVEWIRAGVIGAVGEVHVWTDRPIWPQGIQRPQEVLPVPPHLKWDLWLGPAPKRPYHPAYHPFKWRGFWDFGTGALGDMGCHNMDMAFWSLDLGYPSSVEAETSGVNEETAPSWSIIRYEFPRRGQLPPVTLTWYDGGKKPAEDLIAGEPLAGNGAILVGDKGRMYVPFYWGPGQLFPEAEFADYKGPEPTLPRSPGHYQEWIQACKGGPPALSNFDYAAVLTETVLLGNVAIRAGKKLVWNAQQMRAENCPEAEQFVRREYRPGWTL